MSNRPPVVEQFVADVLRRRNLHRLWNALAWAVAIGTSTALVVGLVYVTQGYALPRLWIAVSYTAAIGSALIVWAATRLNAETAAQFADQFFHLNDGVSSCVHFSAARHQGGYYALQSEHTTQRVQKLDVRQIRYRTPHRLLCITVALAAMAIPIGLAPTSQEVLNRQSLEQRVLAETAAIKAQLLKQVDQIAKEVDGTEEEKLVAPDQLRKLVESLKATPDRTEALRDQARLEQKLAEARHSLKRKDEEQFMARAAAELAKSDDTKGMADLLAGKQYDKAAAELQKLKPNKKKSAAQNRRDLSKLKSITQRMAMVRQSSQTPRDLSADKQQSDHSPSKDKSSDAEKGETLDELIAAVTKTENVSDAEIDESKAACKHACEHADELSDKLKKLSLCQSADSKLAQLTKSSGESQSKLASASPNAGGREAGFGTNTARRKAQDAFVDNGQTTQLKGRKGAGPSITSIESAETGTGSANRRQATATKQAFKHQLESFVRREDVPEAMKDGVKQYFQIIHDADAVSQGASPE